MNVAPVVAIALASAAGGAALTGWILSTNRPEPPAGVMATNAGYVGPASVPLGPMPADLANPALKIPNPYGNSPEAVADGKKLFKAMNCASCHGYNGVGGMGPELDDDYWRYGGYPVQIYKSIYEGRPQGMPAWGMALPASEIWALTAYISSLGGSPTPTGAGARGSNSGTQAPQPSRSGAGQEGQ